MGRATADILPACVIHKILCYLSYGEASRLRILSKTWLLAWSTLPNLEFSIDYFKETKTVDAIMEIYRNDKIPIDRFGFSDCLKFCSRRHQVFPLIDKWLDIALQNGAKDLFYRCLYPVPSYPFPIFKVLLAKSLRELVLMGCDLMPVSSSSGFVNCDSLRKLTLSEVTLDKNMLKTLLNSCPLIDSFIVERCSGLTRIEVVNLQKIKSVSIWLMKNQVARIQAPTLEHLSYSCHSTRNLNVVECQNLKSLDLSYASISDGFLHNLISRPDQSLEVLKIQHCVGIRQIDSSNLVSLEYIGNQIPQLEIARESRQLKHSKFVLHGSAIGAWFCKLRKLLSNLTSESQVILYFHECNEIDIKSLQQVHHRVACPQMDVLNVNAIRSSGDCTTFVDALLWSCNPKRLNLSSTVEMITRFINRLMDMKNPSHSCNPWHSQLKEVEVFDGKNQQMQLLSELAISTLTDRKEVYFLLDWQHS